MDWTGITTIHNSIDAPLGIEPGTPQIVDYQPCLAQEVTDQLEGGI